MRVALRIIYCMALAMLCSCHKLSDLTQSPELTPLEQGFKTSAMIGYCASLANTAFSGQALPANVSFSQSSAEGYSSSGIVHVQVTQTTPLPFNNSVGDLYIAGLWDGVNGGVISIVFGNINVITSQIKIYGIYAVPVTQDMVTGTINTVFAQEDIILGQGSDTLLDLSLSKPKFDTDLTRLNSSYPTDVFTAVKQSVWFISINPNNTPSNIYDDILTVNGGGQIVQVTSTSEGVLYNAMIQTQFSYATCPLNPLGGIGFVQNIEASGSSVDLGNITLDFHNTCDGKALVELATGKYLASTGQNIDLNWN